MIDKTESILLGTIISIPEYQDIIISELITEYFSKKNNQIVFKAIKKIHQNGDKIDLLTVGAAFSNPELEQIGGAYYISSLTSHVASGANYEAHIRILKENYIRTNLIKTFSEEINRLIDRTYDIQETQLNVTAKLDDLFNINSDEVTNIFEVMTNRLDDYSNNQNLSLLGLSTGHSKLNKITNGWQPGDLIILAARPSMGKTAISLMFAKFPALNGKNVLYFSLEMQKERIADRLISLETNINSLNLQSGKIKENEWGRLDEDTFKYKNANLYIDDRSGLTIEEIRATCLKFNTKKEIDLIVIDYLQLIKHSGGGNTTNDKVGHISKNCKELAKKCKCPVMALSQLSRAVESRTGDKRPQLSDLRDSGSIEQDADIIMFLYRPEYYGFTEDSEGNNVINLIETIVAKNRNGPLGSTYWHKTDDWSYIGEISKNELDSFDIPFNDETLGF